MDLFLKFLAYAGIGLALLLIGLFLFTASTKTKEFPLIGKGNQAAAMSVGGKLVGLSFVIGSAIAHSVSLVDMMIWGGVGIVAQIVCFFLADLITIRFSIKQAIEADNRAVGMIVFFLSLSVGWVLAQCLTY
ncbi:DUF350 domain-containing protein [Microbacteriaceae bacterium 4G12]